MMLHHFVWRQRCLVQLWQRTSPVWFSRIALHKYWKRYNVFPKDFWWYWFLLLLFP